MSVSIKELEFKLFKARHRVKQLEQQLAYERNQAERKDSNGAEPNENDLAHQPMSSYWIPGLGWCTGD